MASKKFTKEEVFNLTEDDDATNISSSPAKHGQVLETWVVKYDDKYWRFSFFRDEDEGWLLDGGVNAVEVKLQEKMIVVKEWVVV